jgi:hypothetical protein
MPAAANESQGLKIAVAAFITLSVILTVTSYFLYSAYSQAELRAATAGEEARKAKDNESYVLKNFHTMRQAVGTRAEEFDAANDEIEKHLKARNTSKVEERLNGVLNAVTNAITKAKSSGANTPEIQEAQETVQRVVASFRQEPNKTYISSLDRALELMESLSMLSTELAVNYENLRRSLEGATGVAKKEVDVQAKAAADSRADLEGEHKKHEEERQILLTKTDQLQTDNDKKNNEIATLASRIKQMEEDTLRKQETLSTIIRDLRDRIEQKETTLDRPDGYVTYVDYERRELLLNITRRQGARPQMKMSIFDSRSPGIPTEKPKGTIEITQVGDQFSTARIVKTINPIDPIRVGDIVYSAAWSPNIPMRFALVGKIDINRDGRGDRQELKRMIEEAGGVVDFDLPPPDEGKETGALSPRIDWYVTDDRPPLRDVYAGGKSDARLTNEATLLKRMGEVIKEARLDGIRPMPIQKLLAFLGYDMSQPVMGTAEAVDNSAIRRLTGKRQVAAPALTKPAAEPKQTEEMKDDETKDEPKPKAKKSARDALKKADKAEDDTKKADDDTKKADDNEAAPK